MSDQEMTIRDINGRECMGFPHVIKKGDTLYDLSRKYHVKVSALILANPYVNIYNLQIGDTICIPGMRPEMLPVKPELKPVRPELPPMKPEGIPAPPLSGDKGPEITEEHGASLEERLISMTIRELLDEWDISYSMLLACLEIIKRIKNLL